MANNDYLEKMWIGSNLTGIREVAELSTFNLFQFEDLPPIKKELTNDFIWLKPVIKSGKLRHQEFKISEEMRATDLGKGNDYSESIIKLEKQLREFGIELPQEIITFFSTPDINGRIRSTTDNFYELGDFIDVIRADQHYYMLHFYSDSQYCFLWYICFREDGSHFIIATPKLYGHKDDNFDYNEMLSDYSPSIGYFCANSFKEFIYHYNLEQRIWLKTNWYEEEFAEDEQEYVNHYLKLSNKTTKSPNSIFNSLITRAKQLKYWFNS